MTASNCLSCKSLQPRFQLTSDAVPLACFRTCSSSTLSQLAGCCCAAVKSTDARVLPAFPFSLPTTSRLSLSSRCCCLFTTRKSHLCLPSTAHHVRPLLPSPTPSPPSRHRVLPRPPCLADSPLPPHAQDHTRLPSSHHHSPSPRKHHPTPIHNLSPPNAHHPLPPPFHLLYLSLPHSLTQYPLTPKQRKHNSNPSLVKLQFGAKDEGYLYLVWRMGR